MYTYLGTHIFKDPSYILLDYFPYPKTFGMGASKIPSKP